MSQRNVVYLLATEKGAKVNDWLVVTGFEEEAKRLLRVHKDLVMKEVKV